MAAWRDLSGLRDPDRFEAWLHRVLVRECYRVAKRERRRIEVEGQVRPLTESADPGHQNAHRDELERGFARLPVDQRTVLVLHHYAGYSFPEDRRDAGHPRGHGQVPCPPRHQCHAGGAHGRCAHAAAARDGRMSKRREPFREADMSDVDTEQILSEWFEDEAPSREPARAGAERHRADGADPSPFPLLRARLVA